MPGETTTSIAIGPGRATLNGTVVGPNGPVGGADVHVERLVGSLVAQEDVPTQADGTWSLPGVLGGRYRVRAWRAPDLALTTPQIFFLNGTDTRSLTLQLQQFNTGTLTAAIAPDPPIVGPAGDAGRAADQPDGRRHGRGPGPSRWPTPSSSCRAPAAWSISQPNPAITGPDGSATWTVDARWRVRRR